MTKCERDNFYVICEGVVAQDQIIALMFQPQNISNSEQLISHLIQVANNNREIALILSSMIPKELKRIL